MVATHDQLSRRVEAAWALRDIDAREMRAISLATLAEAEALDDRLAIAHSLRSLAHAGVMQAEHGPALARIQRAQAIYRELGHQVGLVDSLGIMARLHLLADEYGEALGRTFEALAICDRRLPAYGRAELLGSAGIAYFYLGDPDQAIGFFEQALEEARAHGHLAAEMDNANSLGYTLARQGEIGAAARYCEYGLALARQLGAPYAIAYTIHSLGEIYSAQEDLARAAACFEEGLAVSQRLNQPVYACANLRGLADISQQCGEYEAALSYLNKAQALLEARPNLYEMSLVHEAAARACEARRDYAPALAHFRSYHQLQRRLLDVQADQCLKGIQVLRDLEQTSLEAEDERQKNRALQRQLGQYERHMRDLDAYAHTVAHDLRNPISIVTGFGGMLRDEIGDQLTDVHREALDLIYQTGCKMEQIVEGLLLLATDLPQEDLLQSVEMDAIFDEAWGRVAGLVARYGARIDVVTPLPAARGYPAWLEEVWVNYLSNAIQRGGAQPRIEVGAEVLDEGRVRYQVRDFGASVLPGQMRQIFSEENCTCGPDAQRGQGLSVVRRIVERLGGQVGVTSSALPGEGTTFFFTLHGVAPEFVGSPA